MTVHEKAVGATVEWYTPASLFAEIGLMFDLDPAAGVNDFVPAMKKYAGLDGDDGLLVPWTGRVWLNPPYGAQAVPFIERMRQHGSRGHPGILLVAARTETRWFQQVAAEAHLVCFLRDRIHFVNGTTRKQSRSSHASVLMAWGRDCVEAVWRADLGWTPWTKASDKSVGRIAS